MREEHFQASSVAPEQEQTGTLLCCAHLCLIPLINWLSSSRKKFCSRRKLRQGQHSAHDFKNFAHRAFLDALRIGFVRPQRPALLRLAPRNGFLCSTEKICPGGTPKIKGYDYGDNFANTFRVDNGSICVRYDGYDNKFQDRFGHLFYKAPYSNYVIGLEYRFVGQQLPDGPGWATRNSGIMIHCQKPETIRKDQDFPVCIEVQLLGGDGKNLRHTGNLCSPGTHVVMNEKLLTQHCFDSRSETYHGEQWVKAEIEVHGNGLVIHRINGQAVLEYEKPQLDPGDADAKTILNQTGDKMLYGGYISLQSESHPVEFRAIQIRQLSH